MVEYCIYDNSCFLIKGDKLSILIDPFLKSNELNKIYYDYVLISHNHLDHTFNLNKLDKNIIAPKEICLNNQYIEIEDKVIIKDIIINKVDTFKHPRWFQKSFLYDYLSSYIAFRQFKRCKVSNGYIIKIEDEVIYYSGDTLYSKELFTSIKNRFNPTICFISFEEKQIPLFELLVPMSKFNNIKDIFKCDIIPIHQTRKWYINNLNKFIENTKKNIYYKKEV